MRGECGACGRSIMKCGAGQWWGDPGSVIPPTTEEVEECYRLGYERRRAVIERLIAVLRPFAEGARTMTFRARMIEFGATELLEQTIAAWDAIVVAEASLASSPDTHSPTEKKSGADTRT